MSHRKTQFSDLDRRRFLCHTWDGVTASLALALLPGRELFAASSFGDNPFTLGVASGDPTPDGIVLWTRLAPDPVDPARLGYGAIPVRWRVATDSGMRHVVVRGTARAEAALAHSVHVEVNGLQPGRDYFYQLASSATMRYDDVDAQSNQPRSLSCSASVIWKDCRSRSLLK